MMAAPFVLDNFKGVGRQQNDGLFIPKSCSEPFFASNELCWAQERSHGAVHALRAVLEARNQ
jgi:hypothetical protein